MPKSRFVPSSTSRGSRGSSFKSSPSPWRGLLDSYRSPKYRPQRMTAKYGSQAKEQATPDRESTDEYEQKVESASARSNRHEEQSDLAQSAEQSANAGQSILCVAADNDVTGAAVYDPADHRLIVVEDAALASDRMTGQSKGHDEKDSSQHAYVQRVISECEPGTILINEHSKREVTYTIRKEAAASERRVIPLPGMDFDERLLGGYFDELHVVISCAEKQQTKLKSGTASAAALTALLSYLCKMRAQISLQKPLALTFVSFTQVMEIDKETQIALGIFDRESTKKSSANGKDVPTSLYGLLSHGCSTPARHLLRSWLLRPSLVADEIVERQDVVSFFLEPTNVQKARSLQQALHTAKGLHRALERLSSDHTDASLWKILARSAAVFREIRIMLSEPDCAEIKILADAIDMIDDFALKRIADMIVHVVDFDESTASSRACIQQGVDPDLDRWRDTLIKLPSILLLVADRIRTDYASLIFPAVHILDVEYFPQLGYFIALSHSDGRTIDRTILQLGEHLGWTHRWSSEIKAFFKSDEMHEMDVQLGDLHSLIIGREIELIEQLRGEVLKEVHHLAACAGLAAHLECLIRFAEIARRYRYTRPVIKQEPVMYISEGRHPLQEHLVQTFIANDTKMDGTSTDVTNAEPSNSVLIITGANACGKSVYMRQNALIVVMAQIGCFVPARRAAIGIADKIFACMPTTESMGTGKGSFHRDMTRLSSVLQRSTPRSLIILDELGKGTAPSDGASIFAATIRHFIRLGEYMPRVFAATHFHEVFHDDILPLSLPHSTAHMQVLMSRDDVDEAGDARLTFLYELSPGLELSSHASQCEKLCGLPQNIVDRAAYVAQRSRNRQLDELVLRTREEMSFEGEEEGDEVNETFSNLSGKEHKSWS